MDQPKIYAPADLTDVPDDEIKGDFDFEIEDVTDIDIFTPFALCSSTCSSACCG